MSTREAAPAPKIEPPTTGRFESVPERQPVGGCGGDCHCGGKCGEEEPGGGAAFDFSKITIPPPHTASPEEDENEQQADMPNGTSTAVFRSRLATGGMPLSSDQRARFEPILGANFSSVRIHTGYAAAGVNERLGARAATMGNDIAFASGAFAPGTLVGDAILAHELAHVAQQRSGAPAGADPASAALEADADRSAFTAVKRLWTRAAGAARDITENAAPRMRSGVRLQRCGNPRTPDGVDLGPTDRSKTLCTTAAMTRTFGTGANTTSACTGTQTISSDATNTGNRDGHACNCSCGVYRHWVKGYWRTGSATAPKRYGVRSCGNSLTLNETTYAEEWTSCISHHSPCHWSVTDYPGWSSIPNGTYIELHYDFKHEMWDACQGRSVETAYKTLDISGRTAPRTVSWS